jgi:hypothetical protein
VCAGSANSGRGTHASLSIEATSLTPPQTAALGRYRARWTAIRRCTEPADRSAAEEGVRLAYRAAGLAPPARIVWCDSPRALWECARAASRADGPNVKSAVVDRLCRRVAAQVRSRAHARVLALVGSMVDPADALVASAAELVIEGAGREDEPLLNLVRRSYPLSWSTALDVLLGRQGFRYAAIGPHDLSWLGTYDYLREMLGLREETAPLVGLWWIARSAGWLQPHRATCWLAERPSCLRGDLRDRLHDASGPALRYPDGWSVWAWKGVAVPRWIIERPDDITLEAIDVEANVQVRRCMIEIMTPARYVALGGAVRIAEDEAGVLWRRIWFATDAWAAVEVINATPEADGTRRHFFLQVPAHMRTAREAVAWTYGLETSAYANLVMRT